MTITSKVIFVDCIRFWSSSNFYLINKNWCEIHASRNLWCNLRISVKTRRDMDIIEMATANTRSDMHAAVNMETSWGKSLEMLPQFTIKEIEQHRQLSGRTPESAIIKTLDRGRKFKYERYITSQQTFVLVRTYWRRLEVSVIFFCLPRRLEDITARRLANTSWKRLGRRLEDVLKTF